MDSLLKELYEAATELLTEARNLGAWAEGKGSDPLDEGIERRVVNALLDCDAAS